MAKVKKPKELSAGIIFQSECKTKIFMGRATFQKPEKWDIPKGHVEPGETNIQAAIRECQEETGFIVSENDLVDIGLFKYSSNKDLYVFMHTGSNLPQAETALCTAMFTTPWGGSYPELDKFEWVDLSDIPVRCGVSLRTVLTEILDLK